MNLCVNNGIYSKVAKEWVRACYRILEEKKGLMILRWDLGSIWGRSPVVQNAQTQGCMGRDRALEAGDQFTVDSPTTVEDVKTPSRSAAARDGFS
ncbi:hypothetical protein ACSQ67_008733 [Phaseolus vulgaris]